MSKSAPEWDSAALPRSPACLAPASCNLLLPTVKMPQGVLLSVLPIAVNSHSARLDDRHRLLM